MTTYFYLAVPAIDPVTGDFEGLKSASGQVFDPGDTDFSNPVSVDLGAGSTTIIDVSTAGYMPPFSVAAHSVLIWKSGSYTVPLQAAGPPVPAGGLSGQALVKTADIDYQFGWGDVAASGSGGGNVLTLGTSDPVPAGTAAGTVIVRTDAQLPAPAGPVAFIASTTMTLTGALSETVTVPAGVSASHLAVMVIIDQGPNHLDPTASGWSTLSPSHVLQTAETWSFTRTGLQAADTFTVGLDSTKGALAVAWYDASGVGTLGSGFDRQGVTSGSLTFPSLVTTTSPQSVLMIGVEKSTRPPVTSVVSQSAGQQDVFIDGDLSAGTVSIFIGRFAQTAAAPTPDQTIQYNAGSESTRGYGYQVSLLA